MKAWCTAPNSCSAPHNDLCLLKATESYMKIDKQVAGVALKKLKCHLWYLSENLIGLALFSDHVNSEDKKVFVAGFQMPEMKNDILRVDPKSIDSFQAKPLADCHKAITQSLSSTASGQRVSQQ